MDTDTKHASVDVPTDLSSGHSVASDSTEEQPQEAVPVSSKNEENVSTDPRVVDLRAVIPSEIGVLLTDGDCLRFLRARSYNTSKAADMIVKWGKWWDTQLPGIEALPKDISLKPDEQEDIYRRMLPHANLGEDRDGRPIYWEKTGQSK